MKKVGQQLSPRTNSPSQQYFNNRLGYRVSPKNSRLADTAVTAASSSTARQLLNAPIATSRTNRSKSIREALDSIKQRSVSKDKPVLRRLMPSIKSPDKLSDNVELHKQKSPGMRPLANITGSFLNKTINGFSKIKPARDHTKDSIKMDSMESSTHDMLKKSILQPPQAQNTVQARPERKVACKQVVDPTIRDKMLEELLFGRVSATSNSYIIQDSEDRSDFETSHRFEERQSYKDSLLLQDSTPSCGCGCRSRPASTNQTPTQLQKRLARLPTESIFDYINRYSKKPQSIPLAECRELLSRFLVCHNIVYRYEDLQQFLQHLYEKSRSSGVCYRKVGRYLSTFTESDRNRIKCVWESLKREFISVGEIKVTVLQNHTRTFYESVRDAFACVGFKDDEEICYWDLYSRREKPEACRLVQLLWESSLMGTEFRISNIVPEKVLAAL